MSQYGAEGAARQGLGYREIVAVLLPRHDLGHRPGAGSACRSPRTPRDDLVVQPPPGPQVRDTGAGAATVLPDNGATRWRIEPRRRRRQPRRLPDRAAGTPARRSRGGRVLRRRPADHAGHALAAAGLPRPAPRRRARRRLDRPRHRQLAAARELPQGRRAAGDAGARGAPTRSAPRPSRPAPTRRTSAATRAPATTRSATPPPARSTAGYAAEHPASNEAVDATRRQVLTSRRRPAFTQFAVQQRRLDLGGLGALPAGAAGPLRRLDRQPGALLDARLDDAASSAPGRRSATSPGSWSPPGTGTATGAAGSGR